MGNTSSSEEELNDTEIVEYEKTSKKDKIIISWKPDSLDFQNNDFKFNHSLENLLHNYFLICKKDKIININIKKYSTQEKSKYCKLLLKIHKSIKENEEIIEDVIENFPFEYKEKLLELNLIENSDNIECNVVDNILLIFEYITNKKYSTIYSLYNLFLENNTETSLSIKEALDSINKNGVCLYEDCFDTFQEPSTTSYRNALYRNQITCLSIKQDINDLKECLNQDKAVIFGISIYDSFYQYEHIELPKKKDKKIIDISMLLVGYNDEEREWIIQSDKIYKISYNYLLNKNLCRDFWIFNV